jgi:diguanylate cyclase (GGDEF)-like protein
VVLSEHPGSTFFVCTGGSRPSPEYAEIRIDTTREQSGAAVAARSGLPLFIADAATSPVAARRLVAEFGAASVLYLPIPGEGGFMGAVVVWWRELRRSVDPFAQQVAELLPTPAGQVLQRLRHAGQFAKAEMKDDLTGLGNRRRFDAGLTELPASGAILLFDLDALRDINSRYGLDAGDETLRAFADALRRSVRDNDIVARFGGDDFGVILPVIASPIAGGIIIERLQRIWQSPYGCQFSVGIAIRSPDEPAPDTLRRAEEDLLASKTLKSGSATEKG